MNISGMKGLKGWNKLLWQFTKREWLSVFVWSGLGAAAAGVAHLVLWDHSFRQFLVHKYVPSRASDDPRLYLPYALIVVVAVFLGIALHVTAFLKRGLRSWWEGVTSGLALLPFMSTLLSFSLYPSFTLRRLIAATMAVAVSFVLSFLLYL